MIAIEGENDDNKIEVLIDILFFVDLHNIQEKYGNVTIDNIKKKIDSLKKKENKNQNF